MQLCMLLDTYPLQPVRNFGIHDISGVKANENHTRRIRMLRMSLERGNRVSQRPYGLILT
jgi:hypothetical protein